MVYTLIVSHGRDGTNELFLQHIIPGKEIEEIPIETGNMKVRFDAKPATHSTCLHSIEYKVGEKKYIYAIQFCKEMQTMYSVLIDVDSNRVERASEFKIEWNQKHLPNIELGGVERKCFCLFDGNLLFVIEPFSDKWTPLSYKYLLHESTLEHIKQDHTKGFLRANGLFYMGSLVYDLAKNQYQEGNAATVIKCELEYNSLQGRKKVAWNTHLFADFNDFGPLVIKCSLERDTVKVGGFSINDEHRPHIRYTNNLQFEFDETLEAQNSTIKIQIGDSVIEPNKTCNLIPFVKDVCWLTKASTHTLGGHNLCGYTLDGIRQDDTKRVHDILWVMSVSDPDKPILIMYYSKNTNERELEVLAYHTTPVENIGHLVQGVSVGHFFYILTFMNEKNMYILSQLQLENNRIVITTIQSVYVGQMCSYHPHIHQEGNNVSICVEADAYMLFTVKTTGANLDECKTTKIRSSSHLLRTTSAVVSV